MDNEGKILQLLEQMNGRLDNLEKGQAAMQGDISGMQSDISMLKEDMAEIKEDMAEVKEHAEVARSATNSLVEWADTVGVITQVKFPIKKANNE